MSDTAVKKADDGPLGETDAAILTVLAKAFPNAVRILMATADLGDFDSLIPQLPSAQRETMTDEEIRRSRLQTLQNTIHRLGQVGLVRTQGAAGSLYVEITASGLRWLGQRRSAITWDEQDNLNQTFMEQLAKMVSKPVRFSFR